MPQLRKYALVPLVVILGLTFIEVVCSSTNIFLPEGWLVRHKMFYEFIQPDDVLLFKPRPNLRNLEMAWPDDAISGTYSTDNFGFRNMGRDYANSKIFIVGDSYVWGTYVSREEGLCGVVEAELEESVINLGVGGYDFLRYEILFDSFVAKYKPDVVVLGVFANDLVDRSKFKGGYPGAGEDYYKALGWDKYQHFPTYKKTLTYNLFNRGEAKSGGNGNQYNLKLYSERKVASNGLTLYKYRGADKDYLKNPEAIQDVESHFSRIIKIAHETNVILVAFLFPTKESTYKQEYQRLFPQSAGYLRNEEIGYEMLCRHAQSSGVVCVDLTEVFRQHGENELLYHYLDNHWNPAGNRLAATEVAKVIRNLRSRVRLNHLRR